MDSLLEVFGILFETDAKEVKEGMEKTGKATDDLEEKIQETDVAAEKLGESFLDVITSAKGAIASFLGISATTAAILNTAQQTDELGKFTQALGLNIEEVDAWGQAVIRAGGTPEALRGSIKSLTDQLTDFAITGGGTAAEVFARLGIQAFDSAGQIKSAFDVLPELASAFENLTEAEAVGFGQKLGLDQSTILLLQQGRREVDELIRRQKVLGVTTQEDADIAAAFNNAWADTRQVFRGVVQSLNTSVLPILSRVFGAVNDFVFFLRDNRVLATSFFIGIAGVITALYTPAILSAVAATALLLAPILGTAAVVGILAAAIALVVEDIIAFNNGQNSLLGTFIERWPLVGEIVGSIGRVFSALGDTIGVIAANILTLPDDFSGSMTRIIQALLDLSSIITAEIGNTFDALVSAVAEKFPVVGAALARIQEGFGDFFTLVNELFSALLSLPDDFSGSAERIGNALTDAFTTAVANAIDVLKTLASYIVDDLPSLFSGALGFDAVFEGVRGFLGGAPAMETGAEGATIADTMKRGQQALTEAATNPLAGQTSGSILQDNRTTANRNTHVSVGTVSVDARGGDSKEIAGGVGGALSEQLQQTLNDYDNGLLA